VPCYNEFEDLYNFQNLNDHQATPRIVTDEEIIDFAAGGDHAGYINKFGELFMWGGNEYG
jgi:alpha-tubulin suppressor-like RCC1 family protein